jgi:hypothetical protein
MAAITTTSVLTGLYKEVYADTIYSLLPEVAKLTSKFPFKAKKKLGNQYHQPVILTAEQGFTYAGANAGAFALNAAISMSTQDAKLDSNQIAVRYRIDQEAAVKSVGAGKGDKAAFREATQLQYQNVMESFGKRLEWELLYGGSIVGTAASKVDFDGTTTILTFPSADWADGFWAGMENAAFNFYNAGTLISSGADAIFTVSAVNLVTRAVTFTGTSTGTTALQAVAATDIDAWLLGSKGNQMIGLKSMMTTSGVLWNINNSTYNLWKTPQTDFGGSGALTFPRILQALIPAVGRGLSGAVEAYVSPTVWQQLATDLAALRTLDSSYSNSKIDVGTQEITYFYQGGPIKIISHLLVKNGDVFVIKPTDFCRIGATDITTAVPDGIKGANSDMFYMLPDNMGYESRMYCDQAMFCEKPATQALITGFALS